MYHLSLYFKGTSSAYLIKTEFSSSSKGSPTVSLRGSGLGSKNGSFQWSKGVRALSNYLVAFSLWEKLGNDTSPPYLEGSTGSDARTLQTLLKKHPIWLQEMFAHPKNNLVHVDKFFIVSAYRKSSAPSYTISFSPKALNELSVTVYWNERSLEQPATLRQLLSALASKPTTPFTENSPTVKHLFLEPLACSGSKLPQRYHFHTELLVSLLKHQEFIPHDRAAAANDNGICLRYSLEKTDRKLDLRIILVDFPSGVVLDVLSLSDIPIKTNWKSPIDSLLNCILTAT